MRATSYPEADAIMDKLGAIFKNNRAHDWIEVDFKGWSSNVNEQNKFSNVRDAIINNQVISFNYVNASGSKSRRSAEPVKLIFNANSWYMIAYCLLRDSYRMFRLSRIKSVQVTDQRFSQRETPEYESRITNLTLIDLKLRCDGKILNRLYDTFDGDCISENEDGSYDLTVTLPEEEWVYGYILSFGGHAEVLEPEHVREIIKSRAREIAEKYLTFQ